MSAPDDQFGFVLHNLATGEDLSTFSEAESLTLTDGFPEDADWSLWKVRRDGTGESVMIAVGTGPAREWHEGHRRRCPECRGRGQLPGMIKTTGKGSGMGSAFGPCPTCDGVGYITDGIEE